MIHRGRFAPSPTGPLHLGSLVTAVASYLDARRAGGEWLVRVEDLDGPRTVPGADTSILETLRLYGFRWDGEVVWQSRRLPLYREALERLRAAGLVYPCGCSRREAGAGAYPGTCRDGLPPGKPARAWRVRVPDEEISFEDRLAGRVSRNLARDSGDFVLLRADGIFAYQLAVVVDDAAQGITSVVRGADLIDSTPQQIYVQQLLGYARPAYSHVPLVVDARGDKLSKQTGAPPISMDRPAEDLRRALQFLGHEVPPSDKVDELWRVAL